METAKRRIILLGKAGSGKSSTGNTLLGCDAFEKRRSRQSATRDCKLHTCFNKKRNMLYTIVDTPGFLYTEGNLAENLLQIQSSVEICPEPDAFLLVFSSFNSLNDENVYTVDLLRIAFGEQIFNHCIVVFTHGHYFRTDEEFTSFWLKQNDVLIELIKKCGYRIIRIENEQTTMISLNDDVNRIYDNVERMSDSGKKKYNCQIINTHRHRLQVCLSRNQGQTYMQQLATLVDALDLEKQQFEERETLEYIPAEHSVLARSSSEHHSGNISSGIGIGHKLALGAVVAVGVAAAGYATYVGGHAVVEQAMSPTVRATVVNRLAAAGSAISTTAVSLASKAKFWDE